MLKDLVFDLWRSDGCEERSDTLKMLALVDFYLPFLPLERQHIEKLFGTKLAERRKALVEGKEATNLTWDEDVVNFLTDRVRLYPNMLLFFLNGRQIVRHKKA